MKRSKYVSALCALIAALHITSSAGAQSPPGVDASRYAAILRAADARIADTALFGSALRGGDVVIRRAAAAAVAQLAQSHRAFAISSLRPLVADADSAVAASAALGLGLARDSASVAALATAARSRSRAAPAAAWALGEIREPARAAIRDLLDSAHLPRATQRAVLIAESKLRPLDFAAVRASLDSRDAEIRWAAAYAVARQRAPAGARSLLEARGGDAAFDAEVARELTAQTAGDSLHAAAIARLRQLAAHADAHVRVQAARSLGSYGPQSRRDMLALFGDRDANVRVAAAQSVATTFASDTSAWRAAWSRDTSYMARRSLLASAAVAGYHFAEDSAWRRSKDWRRRAAAVTAWGGARDSAGSRSVGLDATHDSDGRVRAAAYGVLAQLDTLRPDTTVASVLRRALSDPDSLARESSPLFKRSARDSSLPAPRPIVWYEQVVRTVIVPALAGHHRRATIHTVRGDIVIAFDDRDAPLTVENFISLARRGYYAHGLFHRVVPAFVAQDGDPRGDGNGGPGYAIRDELNLLPYARGAVGMALSGPDTGGSQYFLTLTPQPHLDGHYTVFGMVVAGANVMDRLVEGDAISGVTLNQ